MAVRGGSQCGYCTPGFVCSMAAEYYRADRAPDVAAAGLERGPNGFDLHALSGNLCRCTGYRPIRDAAFALGPPPEGDALARRQTAPPPAVRATRLSADGSEFVRPAGMAEALALISRAPDAALVAGSTDWGVEVNLRGARPALVVAVDRLAELRGFAVGDTSVEIGAGLSLTEVERRLEGGVPLLAQVFAQFASRLIRNAATFGGNLGTASPIGDLAPALLALDATVLLASVGGEREVPLADYFVGYRQTMRRPDELIRAVRIPLPVARVASFVKIAKRRFDDISSVAVGVALDVEDGVVAAGADRARRRRGPPRPRPGDRRGAHGPAVVAGDRARGGRRAGRRGDASERPPGERGVPDGHAAHGAAQGVRDDHPRGGAGMSALSDRPRDPVVGLAVPHESAALHVTGAALYTDDLVLRTKGVLHAYPVQVPVAHGRITELDAATALAVPGVVRVLTAADVPGVNDAGTKGDEPLFPGEVMFYGHAGLLGARRDDRGRPSWRARRPGRLRGAAVARDGARGDRGRQLPGRAAPVERGDVEAGLAASDHVFSGEIEFSGQEHFYLETHCSLAQVDENGRSCVQSSHPAPLRDAGDRRARPRAPEPSRDRPVPADGRRLRRQGDAAARVRGDRRAGRVDTDGRCGCGSTARRT